MKLWTILNFLFLFVNFIASFCKQIQTQNKRLAYSRNVHQARNRIVLTIEAPIPQNGQTHSKNPSAITTNCLNVFDHFVGLALKWLTHFIQLLSLVYLIRSQCTLSQCYYRRIAWVFDNFVGLALKWLTHFIQLLRLVLSHSFPMHLKSSENLRFSDVFRGLRNGALGTNGLNRLKEWPTPVNKLPSRLASFV